MQIELPRNNVYQGDELLLLVPMLFLLAIPKCLLIFKENFHYSSIIMFACACYISLHVYNWRARASQHCGANGAKFCIYIYIFVSVQLGLGVSKCVFPLRNWPPCTPPC